MKITTTFLPKFFYTAIFIFVVFGLMVFRAGGENKTANQSLAAGGSGRADSVAVGQVHQKAQDARSQEEKQQAGINIGKIKVHSLTPLAQSRPSLANWRESVNPSITVSADSLVKEGAPGSNIFMASDPKVILDKSSHQPASFSSSKSDLHLSRFTISDFIRNQDLMSDGGMQAVSAAGGALSEESQIQKQAGDQHQAVSDGRLNVNIFEIDSTDLVIHFNLPRNKIAQSNDIMAKPRLIVNSLSLRDLDPFSDDGTIKTKPSQPAARLISNSETTESKIGIFINAITKNYPGSNFEISAAGGGNRFSRFDHESERQASQGDDGADQIELVKYSPVHEVSFDIIKENINTFGSRLSMLAPKVYAAEIVSAKPIPLFLYQPLAGQIMFKQALEKLPVDQRTPEKIAELITGISQLLSSLPAKGEIFLADGKFSGLTGTAGILSGKVVKGTYRIKIDPVEGIDLIVPAAIEAGLHGPETVMIGLTPGKGKVKTAGEIGGLQKVWQMIRKTDRKENQVLGTQAQAETGDALPTAVLTIKLFRDENKNGVYDSGESLVEWAGVKMDLEPTTQSSSYNLIEGWNLIAFPVAPTSVTTAAEAVQDIAKEGGYVTTISTWEGDKWIEYSQRGREKFGHDFGLVPGRAYFLESQLNSVWTVAGRPVEADKLIFDLSAGWNGVGILREDSTAVLTLDAIQSTKELSSGEVADQMAKWNFGSWDVVVKRRYSAEHHEVYGRDFPVKSIEGYFIHANEETSWTIDDR